MSLRTNEFRGVDTAEDEIRRPSVVLFIHCAAPTTKFRGARRTYFKETPMKTIVKFQCEICLDQYDDATEAVRCEEKGVPDEIDRGVITQYRRDNDKTAVVFLVDKNSNERHMRHLQVWGFRDGIYENDGSPKDNGPGNGHCAVTLWRSTELEKALRPPTSMYPAVARAILAADSQGIKPLVWDWMKGKAVKAPWTVQDAKRFLKKQKTEAACPTTATK